MSAGVQGIADAARRNTREDLIGLRPRHDSFVGIDSDGCVFDSMGPKQRDHFHPSIIRYWGLEAIARELREVAEFVNMRSVWRGQNRFPALLKCFELLAARPDLTGRGVRLPPTEALRAYVNSGRPLGNPSLAACAEATGDPELRRILAWSLAVNASIAAALAPIPPIPWVRRSLRRIHARSDAIVVSQTPAEALVAEWALHGLTRYVSIIAGQELGTKAEHLRMAAGGKYRDDRILLIGDAPGDCRAAREAGVLFYPVNVGDEAASWRRFHDEAYDRFLAGTYAGDYEAALVAEFHAGLPERPPWL